jgi:high-affinity K+ transport system ATPase subunit B
LGQLHRSRFDAVRGVRARDFTADIPVSLATIAAIADGEVLAGSGSINQAAITGESAPVDKEVGGRVYAGTLNELGAIEVRAAKVGMETTLGQIRRMVEEAQAQKAPIERLLNRYAKLYPPAALLLGAGVWFFTGDVLRAITILIVFCPCVMVLATPTALVASIGNAALRGSLIKKGATIEALARVDTIAFDKTGTLTTGAPYSWRPAPSTGWLTASCCAWRPPRRGSVSTRWDAQLSPPPKRRAWHWLIRSASRCSRVWA